MDNTTRETLSSSWALIRPLGTRAAELFYERLFTTHPETKELFRNTDFASMNTKLLDAIDYTIDNLDNPEQLLPVLAGLGERHIRYGVTDHHYVAVGDALLWTLEQGLESGWTEETATAWAAAYDFIASAMQGSTPDVASDTPVTVREPS